MTISLPDPGNRYMSMQVIDEDHWRSDYTFSREKADTRYVLVLVRTLVDPTNPNALEEVHAYRMQSR